MPTPRRIPDLLHEITEPLLAFRRNWNLVVVQAAAAAAAVVDQLLLLLLL